MAMYSLEFSGKWTIAQLPPGALFKFSEGGIALKTEYRTNGKCDCYLLESGEAVGIQVSDDEVVTMLEVVPDEDEE